MGPGSEPKFTSGVALSLAGHILMGIVSIAVLDNTSSKISKRQEVFSVTIEGGKKLGGVSQVEKKGGQKKVLTDPKLKAESAAKKEAERLKAEKIKLKKAALLEEEKKKAAKKASEKKKLEEKKKKEALKKAELEKAKKDKEKKEKAKKEKDRLDKKKLEEAKKKAKEDQAKKKRLEREERDRRIREAMSNAKDQYSGESARAGGRGFGAGRVGGNGMGGGTLRSAEFIRYQNALHDHVKSSWSWGLRGSSLMAKIEVFLREDGVVQSAKILVGSGNRNFDQSILRAVHKSSPVPAPPPHLYNQFRSVNITFDSDDG